MLLWHSQLWSLARNGKEQNELIRRSIYSNGRFRRFWVGRRKKGAKSASADRFSGMIEHVPETLFEVRSSGERNGQYDNDRVDGV